MDLLGLRVCACACACACVCVCLCVRERQRETWGGGVERRGRGYLGSHIRE